MNQDVSHGFILKQVKNGLGTLTLNRPDALNALSLSMIRAIASALTDWVNENTVDRVLFLGAGPRAFCAGGDMKAVYNISKKNEDPSVYFQEEYALNRQIFHYPKPIAAYMNGITMGGGYGIGGNCRHRIVSEKTIFAMPETAIGFFPDVGAMYHLTRCPDHVGRFLALTGERIMAGDMLHAGLADRFVPSDHCEDLDKNFSKPEPSLFKTYSAQIKNFFSNDILTEIFENLKNDSALWAVQTLETMRKKSPVSLAVTNEYYNRAKKLDFDSIIEMDGLLAKNFCRSDDLQEGVRAVLIDKDYSPRWGVHKGESLSPEMVQSYFKA